MKNKTYKLKTVKSQKDMILVFKTSIKYKKDIVKIKKIFEVSNDLLITFDLEDCDKIMRTEGNSYTADQIIEKIQTLGYYCEELE
ncbi:hypothetical protein [Flavobacterium sp. CF136]|uniref:hypothetical protein n=1 Tax=Flavobacterium sp. (strain CF136) TaxID=1144313 RepID=UPI000271852C|nr:hypothetical protein [Flavobacterium sp. CF136]EJL65801.1 hypothetical protein PMI10_01108 [Flavobacterium sp. CF136]